MRWPISWHIVKGTEAVNVVELMLLSPVKAMKMPVVPVLPNHLLLSSVLTRAVEPSKQSVVLASVS